MVQAVSGKLRILRDGNRIGFALRPKHRQRFLSAVQHGYLAESPESGPLVDAFLWWCEAGEIPCVRFQVERECISFTGHENPAEDPHVSLHFSMATRGRILTKTGVPAVAGILFDRLLEMNLSPWDVSAGALPFRDAQRVACELLSVSRTPGMTTDSQENPPAANRETIH
jgi:hypothetical protein